jgi:hypothetical protein
VCRQLFSSPSFVLKPHLFFVKHLITTCLEGLKEIPLSDRQEDKQFKDNQKKEQSLKAERPKRQRARWPAGFHPQIAVIFGKDSTPGLT